MKKNFSDLLSLDINYNSRCDANQILKMFNCYILKAYILNIEAKAQLKLS